uniref:Short chain dehydrogenase retinoldehydrogenase-like protein n=1 Tax=Philodina roseola TaxID=96448 RepID=G3KGX4_PHIRO|nr:short chain dehydrogenase retinoldehydrogenase-like protein [Philodina roseola]
MKLVYAIFYEPESISAIFLLANLTSVALFSLISGAWPLSFVSTTVYAILVYLITRRLAIGHQYISNKNLTGKTVIVTGAATGIGRAAALDFAKSGARVIIGVRGQERAERIAQDLMHESNNGTVVGYDLDLSSLANIKAFADKVDRVDILVNNAGTIVSSYTVTTDGIEAQFGTNYVGHFYLTKLLLPHLMQSRVVNVSSFGHYFVPSNGIDFTFATLKNSYSRVHAYGISKLAQIWHASELTRRYGIKAYSLHPGGVSDTHIHQRNRLLDRILFQCGMVISKTVQQGCMTTLFCALSDDARPGHYHSNCCVREPSNLACDQRRAKECWEKTEELIAARVQV